MSVLNEIENIIVSALSMENSDSDVHLVCIVIGIYPLTISFELSN